MTVCDPARDRPPMDIAIIAMTGAFPGAPDIDAFWALLSSGREGLSTFSDDALANAGIPEAERRHPGYVGRHGVIEEVDRFDTAFFRYADDAAALIDPQHRLFLGQALRAIELAGYDPDRVAGRIGVYAGVSTNTYVARHILPNRPPATAAEELKVTVSNDKDFLTTRVAYHLNLKGPCCSVQTACSSSLVAVHMACEALVSGQCEMALAGGVTVKLPQVTGYRHEPGEMFSADGRVCAFSAGATGTVLGNGLGIVVLKPLSAALRDHDTVRAVIKGSAVNNDGSYKASYEALGKAGQVEVIREAHRRAGVNASQIGYLEAHGTGTLLGDAIEVSALTEAFGADVPRQGCGLGSVKSNIGHLDAAAGVAGLIKTVLMLEHRRLVPSLHAGAPNPNVDFARTPFRVVTEGAAWDSAGAQRLAGVSAFGIGGTNAHLVLAEAPPVERDPETRRAQVATLSAISQEALTAQRRALADHLERHPHLSLADACYTLNVGRRVHPIRDAVAAPSSGALLVAALRQDAEPGRRIRSERRAAFVFSGDCSPPSDLGLTFYLEEPDFREAVDAACACLKSHVDGDPLKALYPGWKGLGDAAGPIALPNTAVMVFQIALAHLWIAWGVRPAAVVGAGLGNVAAASVAGAVSLETAIAIALSADGVDGVDAIGGVAAPGAVIDAEPTTVTLIRLNTDRSPAVERAENLQTACARLAQDADVVLLEFDYRPKLAGRLARDGDPLDVCGCPDMRRAPGEQLSDLLETLGALWRAGCSIDWAAYYRDEVRGRVPLPGHPLFGKRVWIDAAPGVSAPAEQAPRGSAPAEQAPGGSAAEQAPASASPVVAPALPDRDAHTLIRDLVARLMDGPPEDVVMARGFFEHGLSSVHLLAATAELRRLLGEGFQPVAFFECSTLDDLAARLAGEHKKAFERGVAVASHDPAPAIATDPQARFEPFALSDLQEAFVSGRRLGQGLEVGCHIYLEFDFAELDIFRLNNAWARLIARHDMLHTVIRTDGTQAVLRQVPEYHFKVVDLRRMADTAQAIWLESLRHRLSHRVYEPTSWPYFDIRVSIGTGSFRVHFSIDELIADAASLDVLLAEWATYYAAPDIALAPAPVSFRDHCLAERARASNDADRHIGHFRTRLEGLSGQPFPMVAPNGTWVASRRSRLQGEVDKVDWERLQTTLREHGLDPSAFILTVFTDVLRAWGGASVFPVAVTLANRHHDTRLWQAVGPFISTVIHTARAPVSTDPRRAAQAVQRDLYEDIGHAAASGVKVLRALKAAGHLDRSFSVPIVFTSLLGAQSRSAGGAFAARIGHMITQTPQVCLDCQIGKINGRLRLVWDVVEDAFEPGTVRQAFARFTDAVQRCARDLDDWTPMEAGNFRREGPAAPAIRLGLSGADAEQPFPMTDQQTAYAFGRTRFGGAVGTPLYAEIEAEGLDIGRLTAAWAQILDRHPMLTAAVLPDGTMQTGVHRPSGVLVTDLSGLKDAAMKHALAVVADEMMGRAPTEATPNADLRVSRFGGAASVIHLCIDMIVADAYSFDLVLQDLCAACSGAALVAVPAAFEDYARAVKAEAGKPRAQAAGAYWAAKRATLPDGLALVAGRGPRRHLEADLTDWRALAETAKRHRLKPRSILLTAFADVLAGWSRSDGFTIAVPCWERLPLQGLEATVGDFTAMCWLNAGRADAPFADRVRRVEEALQADLAQRPNSGLPAMRKGPQGRRPPSFPVVFTDFDPERAPSLPTSFAIRRRLSRTPQVTLDCSTSVREDALALRWDIAPNTYPVDLTCAMFAGYRRLLEGLRDDPGAWGAPNFDDLIAADPDRYAVPDPEPREVRRAWSPSL